MIDTSRHFQTTESIKRVIESMSYAKFNTLHWHLVDIESFPYESKAYPKLWDGAYTNYERFSQNDVEDIVQHAKYHGIRVIPEFDMPGHANSWCVGYPDICPSPTCYVFLVCHCTVTFCLCFFLFNLFNILNFLVLRCCMCFCQKLFDLERNNYVNTVNTMKKIQNTMNDNR